MRLRPFATPTGRAAPRSAVRGRARNVAALAERGRRAAPRLVGSDQAEPTRSATASTLCANPSFSQCSRSAILAIMDDSQVRRIIHVDMDAFYASVEQRDDPMLKGRPVAVGYAAKRGVVAAASYEARRFGVRSAMPSATAMRKCREIVFVPPRFEVYRAVSQQISGDFRRLHAAGRTPFSRRSLSRCHRQLERHPDGFGDRQGDQGANSRRNRAYGVSRNLLQQIPRQARL